MSRRCIFALAIALSWVTSARVGQAAPPIPIPGGFAADRFTPPPPGDQFETVEGASAKGEQLFRAALTLEDAVSPEVVRHASSAPIQDELVLHASFSATLWDTALLSLSVPFIFVEAGSAVRTSPGHTVTPGDTPTVGDVEAATRFRVLTLSDGALELAVGGALWATTGRVADFTGDGSVRVAPRISASGEGTRFVYAAEISPVFQHAVNFVDVHVGPELDVGAAAALVFRAQRLRIGPEVRASFPLDSGSSAAPARPSLELYGSIHYRLDPFVVGAALGAGILDTAGTPAARGLLTFAYSPIGDPDADRDGIPDELDACPRVRGAPSVDPARHGCPPDRDGDGIADGVDACPDEPGVRSSDPRKNGCAALVDRDGDGIPDSADACPDKKGPADSDPRKNGCPKDTDDDGVPDTEDACPKVPGVLDPDPKKRGCPPDRDGDGIPDMLDACPTVPGRPNTDPSKNGCP